MSSTLLAARDVAFAYAGAGRAVDGASLELARGDWTALLGPNGSGKSTLLRVCAGLLDAQAGSVVLDGAPIASYSARERARRVALLPQYLPALPDVRVREFVLSGRYAHVRAWRDLATDDRAVVDRALERCDVTELADRGLAELSGGQRQRVAIARALAQEASVLLVDEPTTALDPEHQIGVCELLSAEARAGRAVCVVTHDLVLAGQYATNVVLLEKGRVASAGAPSRVLVRERLEPVYGADLHYATWPARPGESDARPLVLPRRRS